jgi:putative transposase
MLADWPAERPGDWLNFVNEPQTAAELEAIRQSVNRGCPFGGDDWQREVVERMGLQATLRSRGRPRNTVAQEMS